VTIYDIRGVFSKEGSADLIETFFLNYPCGHVAFLYRNYRQRLRDGGLHGAKPLD
jgi:hypothetical protein